jgi:hypothetical protein
MVAMNKQLFGQYVKEFAFKDIFNYFGWDNDRIILPPLEVDGVIYHFKSIAQKSGFRIVECYPETGLIPQRSIRNRIESAFSRVSHDHIIIFTDALKKKQTWQFVYRTLAQGTKRIEVDYDVRMNPEKIYERASGLVFDLDEEDKITIIDVVERVKGSLVTNSEKVTKKFYDHFKSQKKLMVEAISGISDQLDKEWYASLMINRLMFCYFIQKRRFLNNDMNYLNNKLTECKAKEIDGFYTFYRNFLLILFHDGFSSSTRSQELIATIGNIPYLNGGLFDLHALEKKYPTISIPDETFEKLFAFFDTWDWHLDSNLSTDNQNEINPDVLGYIFEKYINDRAKLGAYYTKEDITEYISRSTIIPEILEKVQEEYPLAFYPDGSFWTFLKGSGDTYIYEPVKYGAEYFNQFDFDSVDHAQFADTKVNYGKETWHDVLERKNRYNTLLSLISTGVINKIPQLLEHNIDMPSLVYDYLNETSDYGFIYAFYSVIKDFTILDSSCGSGAFLLAALNLMEPLYEGCLSKLEYLSTHTDRNSVFAYAESEVQSYSKEDNKTFWILKRILLNNIYGVDIIAEAVETAKLRLFLKLMAAVEPDYTKENMGIEPLPDIDYNIRHGNTLIGFTGFSDVVDCINTYAKGEKETALQDVTVAVKDVQQLLDSYKELQTKCPSDTDARIKLKEQITLQKGKAAEKLNQLLFLRYRRGDYTHWRSMYRPLHWYLEFHRIMSDRGGFDSVIGNPPYVENEKVEQEYSLQQYRTRVCKNVYTCFVERAIWISNDESSVSMILQLPIVCTDGMAEARKLMIEEFDELAFASFDDRPGKLFDELQHIRVSIFIGRKKAEKTFYTTNLLRWYSEVRPSLFNNLFYHRWSLTPDVASFAKIGDSTMESIIAKLNRFSATFGGVFQRAGVSPVFYHNAPLYWIRGTKSAPFFWNERDGEGLSSQYKKLFVSDQRKRNLLLAVLNSSLFYVWFVVYGDMRHLNRREIDSFPICDISDVQNKQLSIILDRLAVDYEKNKTRKECIYAKTGLVKYDEYHPRPSKPIMDLLDAELAEIYGLNTEELNYIINYDLKFRLGNSGEED